MKQRVWLWLMLLLIGGCNPTEAWMPPPAEQTPLEAWMPWRKGAYFIWEGDSIRLDGFHGTIDTVSYFHKMEIADTFTDGEDRLHLIARHYYRLSSQPHWRDGYAETWIVDSTGLLAQRPGRTLLFMVWPVRDDTEWDLYRYDTRPSSRAFYQHADTLHAWLIHRADSTAIDYYRTAYLLARDTGIIRYVYDSLEITLNGDTTDGLRIRENLTQFYVP